ncbi:lipid-binding SYLF domain-containing protein [Methylacidiphilum caldifontis]|uniref:lipid-binding SYLF domain-containing protein n=1 Tax=Methylacidiphilum caldifontis TaxID=2795386 RepID=UPI001A8F1019|nr:lipid-binding SYLF domain-containing protein [Methylacidiphilum caldifontis]QSR89272.1 lipid-binding SYLF domain-containing protein [Methylacidiphilum caldifontis]
MKISFSPFMRLLSVFSLLVFLGMTKTVYGAWNLKEIVHNASAVIHQFKEEGKIPKSVWEKAKGVAYLEVTKGGFVISGEYGKGLVVVRLPIGGWSGPSAISVSAIGVGLQVGGTKTDYVVILNSEKAIRMFSRGGKVHLTGEMSGVAGPESEREALIKPRANIYTYRSSEGLFGGIALEGVDIREEPEVNERYYHQAVSPSEIFAGQVQPPKSAQSLIDTLNEPYPK